MATTADGGPDQEEEEHGYDPAPIVESLEDQERQEDAADARVSLVVNIIRSPSLLGPFPRDEIAPAFCPSFLG